MTINMTQFRRALRGGAALHAVALLGAGMMFAGPAVAQDTSPQQGAPTTPDASQPGRASLQNQADSSTAVSDGSNAGDVVVTGTLFRRTDSETPSPVTTLTTENLAKAGITNIADAVRSISADNSGSVPTAFANGFGSGAAGVSLRGLTVNSTLVLINGIRTTNYPYADDGQRSFVDLNSIPRSTIQRIEVLRDGASSTYGADAIGGVVNIITRKEIRGIEGTAEGGISQRGDGGEQRVTLTAGYGSLDEQGFNVYLNGEYEHDGLIRVSDRGFPFNTQDLSSIGGENFNNASATNGGAFGTRLASTSAVVRPATQNVAGNIFSGQALLTPGGAFYPTLVLNPAGCGVGTVARNDATGAYCEQNTAGYNTIAPEQKRYGFTGHAAVKIGDKGEGYLEATYYRSDVYSEGAPFTVRQRNPINTTNIVLPVRLANGQLNPYNPYAASGQAAQLSYAFGGLPVSSVTRNDVYRIAGGINGTLGSNDEWHYAIDGTYARSELQGTNRGYLNIAGLSAAINNGTYNFIDPSQNSQAVLDSISPAVSTKAMSELYMVQATVTRDLFQLPGGPLQLGIGASARHEMLNNPNANANQAFLGLNAVTAAGKHSVGAAFFEINAPVFDQLEINGSGRYDHYSEGYDRFSPKIGAKFTPFKQLAIRGTYSRGFRAPSFAEINQGAVIGYTNGTVPAAVAAAHGNNAYVAPYSLGFNSAANPNIKPELSRSFTGGAVFQPLRWLSMTVDYYNIRKTQVISGGPLAGTAIANYYAGQPLPAGYTLVLDDPDPQFPNAIRKVLIVNSPYANAAALKTSGLDVTLSANFRVADNIRLTSQAEVTEIFNYDFKPDASAPYDHYVGTQAPYVLSSGAGTPRWRANWMNSVEAGPLTVTATAYYTSGYKSVAEDQNGHGATSCADNLYGGSDPNFGCYAKHFIDVDLVTSLKVNEKFSFYVNVVNLLDAKPPLNPANYAAINYNPTWSQQGIIGRFFRAGANFKF